MLGAVEIQPVEGVSVEHVAPTRHTAGGLVERFRLVAERDLARLATGSFARPAGGATWRSDEFAPGIEFCGFAFTQFALPVVGDASLEFEWAPADGVRSPRAVLPLIARASREVLLLAPLSGVHEQVIAVGDGALTWGWHGDLDEVPAGFVSELGAYRGDSLSTVLAAWRHDLAPIEHRPRRTALGTRLSYWTDNGAAYWYRTEPGRTIVDSVVETVTALRADGVPIGAVELDSWWYDHETPRPIAEIGYPEEVPPSGTMRWEPRHDAFATSGEPLPDRPLAAVAERLDGAPLVLHARHISPRSPYVVEGIDRGEDWWTSGLAAHPANPSFFRSWFDLAAAQGAEVIEQDWLLMIWFGVPEMRARAGRMLEWQRAMNSHADATGIELLWCMATPADLVEAAHLDRIMAVRTSDDYRYAAEPADLWTWFLTVNRLADALGLPAFKDVFFSNAHVGPGDDAIDGDPHAELEAALSALSGGPVGIGDRLGRTDRDVVVRTCDDDGRLRRVDRPIAFIDRCLFGAPARGECLGWAATTSTTADGVWTYVLAVNTSADRVGVDDRFELGGAHAVLDWRSGSWSASDTLTAELAPRDWALWLVAPPGLDVPTARGIAVDVDRYVVVEADTPGS